MSKSMKLIGLILAAVLTLVLNGCSRGGGGHDVLETYYLVVANKKLPYFQATYNGFEKVMKSMNVKYEMLGPDAYDPPAEVEEFRKAVSKKPTGILVSVANPDLLGPEIDKAIAQGIPVITFDSDAPSSKRLTFVGTDNYEAGRLAAERLAKKLAGAGQFVVFTIGNQENTRERLRGVESVVSGYKFLKNIQTVDMKGDAAFAFDTAQELVAKRRQDIDAFLCLEAQSCKEIADVLDRAGVRNKLVIGFDTDEQTLEWIERGMIDATIAQRPFTMGYIGGMILGGLALDKPASLAIDFGSDIFSPVPAAVNTGTVVVDKGNLSKVRESQGGAKKQ